MSQAPRVAAADARLPDWLEGRSSRPDAARFDSAVVRGGGVGALVCAARLARSDAFRGRVSVVGPPTEESRRLIGGLTLRARSLDYYAAALGRTRRELLSEMYGGRARQAETRLQVTAVCDRDGSARFRLGRKGVWLRSADHAGRVLAYGVRNSGLVAALRRSMADLDIVWTHEQPVSLDECRGAARGDRPVIVEAGGRPPLSDLPAEPPPRSFVLAAQVLFSDPRREAEGVLEDGAGFLGVLPGGRSPGLDVAVFNPVADPLSPGARWYGIVYRIVRAAPAPRGSDLAMRVLLGRYEAELAELRDHVVGVGHAMGLDPVDESETLGQAVVACQSWRDVPARRDEVVELRRIYDAGVPIITGDGMARAGLAGYVAAECLIAGADAHRHTNRSLAQWRRANRLFALGMTRLAPLVTGLSRRFPAAVIGGGARIPEMWVGLE
ncbi:MAG: hypothetical protein ACQGVK_19365 [Myxococcota bacterium]